VVYERVGEEIVIYPSQGQAGLILQSSKFYAHRFRAASTRKVLP
jgi:hypothetical protein